MKRVLVACVILFTFACLLAAQNPPHENTSKAPPTIAEKAKGMQSYAGFFDYYWDAREGKIGLRIDKWNMAFLFYETLPNGVGSNDIGLDRGQPGSTYVVHFERSGSRALLVADN